MISTTLRSKKQTKILFLLESATDPSGRLRVRNFLPYIDRDRYEYEVRSIPNSIFSRPALFAAAARADVIFLHRKLFRPWEIPFISGGRALIFDFDDMVMLPGREKYQNAGQEGTSRLGRFQKTLSAARMIIAGNQFLQSQTGDAMNKTTVIPTTIDSSRQPLKKYSPQAENLVLGWIGTRGNLRYLETLTRVFQRLSTAYPEMILKIVCDGFLEPEGVRTIKKPWRLDDEATDLIGMDIGLMPLPDDLWTKGKCGYKILQYMSAGLPVVASPVGVNTVIVQPGVNGFWATTEAEWETCLRNLIDNPELRQSE
ncbi:MAG: glycosyltransferase family 4 protein [Deltaproteobacteria bacterium]|nr:glycosyltransferase family 4 protein [Deltaproteobacteria bacterium]